MLAETPDTNKQGGGDNADGQAGGTEDNSPDEVDDDVGGRPMDEVAMLRYGSDDAKAAAERAARYYQVAGVLGIGLIALGEEIGTEMTVRAMDNILQ